MAGPLFNLTPEFLAGQPKKLDVQPVMFGGERSVGAPLDTLKKAQEMQAGGATPEDIYAKTIPAQSLWDKVRGNPEEQPTTGWFQGPEGKWRFEFSDKEAQFNPESLAKMHSGESITLDQLLSHPQLFQYYPHLKDVKLKGLTPREEQEGLRGSYNPKENVLQLLRDPAQARSTLMHELQHMIQSKEGFSAGGDSVAPAAYASLDQHNLAIKNIMRRGDLEKQMYEELQGMPTKGMTPSSYDEAIKQIKNKYQKEIDQIKRNIEYTEKTVEQAQKFKRSFDDYEIYRRLGGETESRNVQTRLPMDIAERRKSIPTKTQDYPYEGQLAAPEKE